jgi:hypothetical protein
MTTIEVQAPQEKAQIISVHEGPNDRDNLKESLRYKQESEAPGLSPIEVWAKMDTANNLATIALEQHKASLPNSDLNERTQEYLGNKAPRSR